MRLPGLLAAAVLPLAQMLVLFAGPLLMAFFDGDLPMQQNFRFEDVQEAFATPIGVRNHIAVRSPACPACLPACLPARAATCQHASLECGGAAGRPRSPRSSSFARCALA